MNSASGAVSVDNTFHYLWGGGYVMDAAEKGYIAYTCCTSTLAEVVPFGGKFPTLGTNPHSWAFPTTKAIGFPIVIDWATSTVAMGRVQQLKREGKPLPPNCAVDKDGNPTTDPEKAVALLPFGAHKGYGLGLIDELYGAFIGGSLPTIRGRYEMKDAEKHTTAFFFQCIHPDAVSGGAFAKGRNQADNVKAVIQDILGHGNEKCLLPGQPEAKAAELTKQYGGLLFSKAELKLSMRSRMSAARNRGIWPRLKRLLFERTASMPLKLRDKYTFDQLSLGEIMLRLDPGEGRVRTAREFKVWEGGGEYNVSRGLRKCFGLKTAVCTAFVDNEVGHLIEDFIMEGGVATDFILWRADDGIGRSVRNGLNFTERGFGIRGAVGVPDRGHTAASQLKPGDFDWEKIFGELGVRWFHTGGIFAALSESTAALTVEAVKAANKHGTIVSYDLNYRPSLWKSIGGLG